RAKQRGTSNSFEVFRVFSKAPELFSCLFYVAASRLNSPRFSSLLIRFTAHHCQGTCLECADLSALSPFAESVTANAKSRAPRDNKAPTSRRTPSMLAVSIVGRDRAGV